MIGARVGWGVVGCGWLATDYAAPAVRASRNGHLAAAFDPRRPAAEALGADRTHGSLEALLADPAVGAVYVCTPNHLHAAASIAACHAGKPVLCEKPTARNAEEAQRMVAETRRSGVPIATAFDQRHHPAHLELKRRIDAGELGTLTCVRIHYACWTGRDWAPPNAEAHDNWRVDPRRAGGGAMIDLAPHGLDLFQRLVGERIEDVSCFLQRRVHTDTPVDDGAAISARTASGVLLSHTVAYNRPETFPRRTLEVYGTEAMARCENTMGQDPGGTLTITRAADGSAKTHRFPPEGRSPFLNLVEAFADACLRGSFAGFDPDEDLHTMRLLDRCAGEGARAR
ncbi:Gfo/Idh/MocA family protein [Phycisphaera mikurensis]|uniref:Putative oxidoreductase n=1 Tax=Phycisphaera mikurensis (strain NBRC 102666 / KCTC 22515 / FYK2301M01) TaxID=1142394 RepID=I0IFN1_PHYMF|nr:Gfo/Idh/MocA family oxidoreductase [Phycisphaera mikurensis]MBB6440541.1 putative dehydrogenase [Phycisphaera mikurensis]BAM04069.1 putative oxidoreductase [Phycisphaera mikurensis NBRC 102666]